MFFGIEYARSQRGFVAVADKKILIALQPEMKVSFDRRGTVPEQPSV